MTQQQQQPAPRTEYEANIALQHSQHSYPQPNAWQVIYARNGWSIGTITPRAV